jgi:hypothetical protein
MSTTSKPIVTLSRWSGSGSVDIKSLAFACHRSHLWSSSFSFRNNIRRKTSTCLVRLSLPYFLPLFSILNCLNLFPSSSITSITDKPSDHVSPRGDIAKPSTEPKSNICKRRWDHIVAILKGLWRQHRRKTPLRKRPNVWESVIAIIKSSRESPTADTLPTH